MSVGLHFTFCYRCSTNGLCISSGTKTGKTSCSPKVPGGSACTLSGNDCGIGYYMHNVVSARSNTAVPGANLRVTGLLKDESGALLAGHETKLFLPNGLVLTGYADANGRFEFRLGAISNVTDQPTEVDLGSINVENTPTPEPVCVFANPNQPEHHIDTELAGGTVSRTVHLATGQSAANPECEVQRDDRAQSEAKYCTDGSVQYPVIKITNPTIQVRHETTGGGYRVVTRLDGDGGLFLFAQPGTHQITPGTYKHFPDGNITGNGCIKSFVTYS